MKKCPFCAEEIQDEAIVCRYCGRDLTRKSGKSPKNTENNSPSVWRQGAKGSAVITVLYVIGVFLRPQLVSELVGALTIGLVVTFLLWWLVCAVLVFLWRMLGKVPFVVVAVIFIVAFIAYLNSRATNSVTQYSYSKPTLTKTIKPVSTKTKKKTPTKSVVVIPNCSWWYEVRKNSLGTDVCLQGIIYEIVGNTQTSKNTRFFFNAPHNVYFFDDGYYYPDLAVGDCVYAAGTLRINEQGEMFIQANGNIGSCN